MKKYKLLRVSVTLAICSLVWGCEDYVEIEVPDHKIVKETVFESEETASRAIRGIYNELFRSSFSGGWRSSVTVLAGLSSDILEPVNPEHSYAEFQQNEIPPGNSANFELWSSAYNVVYMANSFLEGLENSQNISENVRLNLEGEAKFVRAFTYFYLVNLYGDVPLILTTDYRINSVVTRDPVEEVYAQIVSDLEFAIENLGEEYQNSDRTNVNVFTAIALRARVALYQGDWEMAETLSGQVINQGSYEILPNLDEVFLANSREAIWQISPIGRGNILTSTGEGQVFIGGSFSSLKLASDFVHTFDPEDKRFLNWIGHYESTTRNFYFPYKYKDRSSLSNITEYSMVLRLAEQYLIRAEARVQQGKIAEAISDINLIRGRAGEELIESVNNNLSKEEILELIMEERKKELFAEWGHRWFDLKRTGKADEILNEKTAYWEQTDIFYPIPEQERLKNINLDQNAGY